MTCLSVKRVSIGERLRMSGHSIENRLVAIQNHHQAEEITNLVDIVRIAEQECDDDDDNVVM